MSCSWMARVSFRAAPTVQHRIAVAVARRRLPKVAAAAFVAAMLFLLPAGAPGGRLPVVSAHNLDQRMVYVFFDPATKAMLDARIPTLTPPQSLLVVNDEIGLIVKVIPTNGTATGVGGYADLYLPNGVTVIDAAYVLPNLSGGYDDVSMKGQALMPSVGAGGGPTVSLTAYSRGPNVLGTTSTIVSASNVNLGTLVGVYGDTGIFYSTDPETAYGSWQSLEGGGTITSNSGDTFSPFNAWDAEQMAAYGIKGSSNPGFPSSPLIDSNGRGNAPWGLASVVAGPDSGYRWQFDYDAYAACDPTPTTTPLASCIDQATQAAGPWKRIRYAGSQIADDPPGNNPATQPYSRGANGAATGHALSPANPLPATVSQTDTTSPKAIRWAVGQLTNGRPEYLRVKLKINSLTALVNAQGCPVFYADTFGGDAGGDSNGKDHVWRYYDPTQFVWNGCLAVGKPSHQPAVKVGETFQYKVSVYNASPTQDQSGVVVKDTLPSGVQFISAVPAASSGPKPLIWNVGSLLRGQKFEAVVTVKATGSGALDNTVLATGTTVQGGDPISSTSSEATTAGSVAILKQSKTVSPTSVAPGASVQYTLRIENIGSGPSISPVRIEEHLPTGFSHASLDSVTVNGTNALSSTTVNASLPRDPIFTVSQPINGGQSLVLKFSANTAVTLSPGSDYCNSFSSFTNVPLTTGSEACVTIGGAALGDLVWRDWNGDGSRSAASEEGAAGVTMKLYGGSCPPSGDAIRTTTADAVGAYWMSGLVPGTYCAEATVPAGYTVTADPQGALDGQATVTLTADQQKLDVDFGLKPGGSGSMGDQVFEDRGKDGSYDVGQGDVGIPNVTVLLYEDSNGNGQIEASDAQVGSTSTNSSGIYGFGSLATGFSYVADVDQADPDINGHFGGGTILQTTADPHPKSNLTGSYLAADFGFYKTVPGSIGDTVCIDANFDGLCSGETGLRAIAVRLYRDSNGNGLLDMGEPLLSETATDHLGQYGFAQLPAGNYIVDVDETDLDLPSGHLRRRDEIAVSLGAGQVRTDVDFPFAEVLRKEVDRQRADPGATLTYTIRPRSPSAERLSNVTVTDPVPAGTTYVSGSASPSPSSGPSPLVWNLGSNTLGAAAVGNQHYRCRAFYQAPAILDTFIDQAIPTDDNGAALALKTRAEATKIKRALIKFDLGGLPASATIQRATLKVKVATTRDEQDLAVRRITRSWTASANWNSPWTNSGGDFGTTNYGTLDPSFGGYQSVTITPLVTSWWNGTFSNHGLILDPIYLSGAHGDAQFRSMEAAGEQPYLDILYEYRDPVGCAQVATLYATQDATIKADGSFENNGDLKTKGTGDLKETLVQFDTSALAPGITIDSASLILNVNSAAAGATDRVHRMLSSWTESSGSWGAGKPVSGSHYVATSDGNVTPTSTGAKTLDITAVVNAWVNGGANNRGLILVRQTAEAEAKYNSREGGGTVTGPHLVVTYRSPTVSAQLPATQDTWVDQNSPTQQNGTATALELRSEPTKIRRAFLQFDLDRVPSGATLSSAQLNLFVNGTRNEQDEQVRRVTRSWTDAATWNSPWTVAGGDMGTTVYGTLDPSNSGYQTVSITSLVSAWALGTFPNYGLALSPIYLGSGAHGNAQVRSMELAGQEPYLAVTYQAPLSPDHNRNQLTVDTSLVGPSDPIQVTMVLTATETINDIVPETPLRLNATGGSGASCGSPSLISADDDLTSTGDSVLFRYLCTASAGSSPGQISFKATAIGAGGTVPFGEAVSNGVLVTPPLSFKVTVNGPPAPVDPVVNSATIAGGSSLPATSDTASTAILASIGDLVWSDLNGDGSLNAGTEPPLAGVQVCATPLSGGASSCATSDADGRYRIRGLDASESYTVGWTQGSEPAGYVATTAILLTVSNTQLQAADAYYTDADFGLRPPASAVIGDTLWIDFNEDGVLDAGEGRLSGVTVERYNSGGTILLGSTTTDSNGNYAFNGLYAGSYQVKVVTSSAVQTAFGVATTIAQAMQRVSGALNPASVTLATDSTVNNTIDFGFNWTGSIGDKTFYDDDGNGVQNGTEAAAPKVVVSLNYDTNGNGKLNLGEPLLALATADDAGVYHFDQLPPGNYLVKAEEQTVDSPTVPGSYGRMVPTGGGGRAVALTAGQSRLDIDFGFLEAAKVEGHVFHDVSHNGLRDPSETGLTPVSVSLTGTDFADNPVSLSTTTDLFGEYAFVVPPGDYTIEYSQTDVLSINAGLTVVTTPAAYDLQVAAGQERGGFDFGVDHAGIVGDRVYNDANGDGLQQAGESGLDGVTVRLFDAAGTTLLDQKATDSEGYYRFLGLPNATYKLRVDTSTVPLNPPGFTQTQDPDESGTCSTCDSEGTATVTGGGSDLAMDFGYRASGVLRTISGRVYDDENNNGDDDTEPGFSGVDVTAVCDDHSYRTQTNGTGDWSIGGIPDGNTCTLLDADEQGLPTTALVATESPATPITLNADVTGLDFGYWENLGSIAGKVCQGSGDGICTGEPALANVDIGLTWAGRDGYLNTADDEGWTTQTDGGGAYSFAALEPGLYQIVETDPPGFESLADADGGNPGNITLVQAIGANTVNQDFEDFAVGNPALELVKTVSLDASCPGSDPVYVTAGTLVTYCYQVTNTGDVHLSTIVVDDDLLGAGVCSFAGPLAPSASQSCNVGATVNADTSNVGTASGNPTDASGMDLLALSDPEDSDEAFVDVVAPAIELQKTVYAGHDQGAGCPGSEAVGALVNDAVTWCFEVTNPAGTGVYLDAVMLDDPDLGITRTHTTLLVGSEPLAPGASLSLYYTATVPGELINTASTSGNPTDAGGTDLPGLDDPSDADSAEIAQLCLGDRVFFDLNNDGLFGAGEFGRSNVVLELYTDGDASGDRSEDDPMLATTTTDALGQFAFCDLVDGDYVISVAASNFAAGGPLETAASSDGGGETPPDPDDDVDADDNGGPDALGGVSTFAVSLAAGLEPTDDGDADPNSNLSVDLGFRQIELPTGARLGGFAAARLPDGGLELRWWTLGETDILGFLVEGGPGLDGPWSQASQILIKASDRRGGAQYRWIDPNAVLDEHFFRLVIVDAQGGREHSGPVRAPPRAPPPAVRLYLPLLMQGAAHS